MTQLQGKVATTLQHFGKLDIVVNNAGTTHRNQPLMDVGEDGFDRCFAVNVKSIFLMTHAVVPVWRESGNGRVMIIPLGRLAKPSDIAAAAVFLASDAAEFISGVEFPVDGARTV